MKVCYLGKPSIVEDYLRDWYEVVDRGKADWLVTYGYRHILSGVELEPFNGNTVNLHISYLPWNRGADPTFWSVLEHTPVGVTLHQIDEGLDTGPLYIQSEVEPQPEDTLRTLYNRLSCAVESLFCLSFPHIVSGIMKPYPQHGYGSYHRSIDKEPHLELLWEGWDTKLHYIDPLYYADTEVMGER